jgi:biopolymer transport protein ExbD
MLDFSTNRTRFSESNIVPMINVVFLLLIFFLMTAQIAPPAPLEISLPVTAGTGQKNAKGETLYVNASGEVAYLNLRGEAAFAALARTQATTQAQQPVQLYADAALSGTDLVRILGRLGAAGIDRVDLVSVRQ